MKKELINGVITILFMCVITIFFIFAVSLCAFRWKWQADVAMQGITGTYIITGLSGGLLHGRLLRSRSIKKMRILKALFYGIVLSCTYWGIPGGIAMLLVKEHISDMGQFAVVWGMMSGSIMAGILFSWGCGKAKGITGNAKIFQQRRI